MKCGNLASTRFLPHHQNPMHRKLLLIAYHFPPIQGSTGTTRTLAFARYLRQYGWDVCVLTVNPKAYENVFDGNSALIPDFVSVERAWALDAQRHLSIGGRYARVMALPDRWQSWIVGGYLRGRAKIKTWRPDVIMSTYPIASAHGIGYLLSRRSGIPWVAEFRDPMLQATYPADEWERRAFRRVEGWAFSAADRVVVTTDGCRSFYADRYPSYDADKIKVISNGYDPQMFAQLGERVGSTRAGSTVGGSRERLVLLHSGVLYPHERNPSAFFDAVRRLKESGYFDELPVEFRFRASTNEAEYQATIEAMGIDSIVKFLPRVSYQEALEEMLDVDGLMLFQAESCNEQIPAKVYEYMFSARPILGLADPVGDTGRLLKEVGVRSVAKLENSDAIEATLRDFLDQARNGGGFVVPREVAERFSRETLSGDLGSLLSEVVGTR